MSCHSKHSNVYCAVIRSSLASHTELPLGSKIYPFLVSTPLRRGSDGWHGLHFAPYIRVNLLLSPSLGWHSGSMWGGTCPKMWGLGVCGGQRFCRWYMQSEFTGDPCTGKADCSGRDSGMGRCSGSRCVQTSEYLNKHIRPSSVCHPTPPSASWQKPDVFCKV